MVDQRSFPVEVEKVYRRFERWRSTRQGREPIPEQLWMAAAKLAREYGVNATSKALGLEFKKLKAFANAGETATRKVTPAPQFLELVAGPSGVIDCVIELESPRGKMRVEWKGVAPDLAGLSQMLWERE